MSYTVMARKRRPQAFETVVAQSHVTTTLQNAIRLGRVAQSYLFSGPRGTGKTTTARLLAMALNCEQGPTAEPCGECASCVAIRQGNSMDVLEIDGASNRGIDEIRQLREEVGYAASQGKRKVYIIDEVHMLTTEAFNALLKTLEEPPAHVVFVFATTEAHKVPETILSRCQRYNFRRIPPVAIVEELKMAVDEEGVTAEESALFLIARKADGGMRDALSLLDQVIAFSDADITEDAIQNLLGLIPRDVYFDLTQAIVDRDGARALEIVDELAREGSDLGEFVAGLMAHFRHLLVACAAGDLTDENLPEADRVQYAEVAAQFEEADLVRMLNAVSELETQISRVTEPRFWLELTVMKLVQMTSSVDLQVLIGRLEQLERGLKSQGKVTGTRRPLSSPRPAPQQKATSSGPDTRVRGEKLPPRPTASKSSPPQQRDNGRPVAEQPREEIPPVPDVSSEEPPDFSVIKDKWEQLVQAVKNERMSLGTFLAEGRPQSMDGRHLVVAFQKNLEFHANQVRRGRAQVEEVARGVFGGTVTISCEVVYEDNKEQIAEEKRAEEDERVQMVMQVFSGEVIR
ncbi:MAG: DNA polymerase III subunit gamma/tau [Gemmatimonadetes bacterium]|nr:DNA polymerase III subunit gamma/tau [Gemmatimonadota bacterium]MYK51576.1 DNA polymerase III subunit gamma/tau [Gemmatimonadota bacterium]